MNLEVIYGEFIQNFIMIFSVIAAFFAARTVIKLKKVSKSDNVKRMMYIIFLLLATGFILWSIAEVSIAVLQLIEGTAPALSISDLFWILGNIFVIAGFATFSIFMFRKIKNTKGLILTIILSLAALALTLFLITRYVLPQQADNILTGIIAISYPLFDVIILTFSISIYVFFRKMKTMGTPLLLLAISVLVMFAADTMYLPITFFGTYGIFGAFADFLYIPQYLLGAIAFYMLSK